MGTDMKSRVCKNCQFYRETWGDADEMPAQGECMLSPPCAVARPAARPDPVGDSIPDIVSVRPTVYRDEYCYFFEMKKK